MSQIIEDIKSSLPNKKEITEILEKITKTKEEKKKKTKKEEKKDPKIYGPNGEKYSDNDINFLVNNGYTKESAIELLSKEEKYTKPIEEKEDFKESIFEKVKESVYNQKTVKDVSEQLKKAAKALHRDEPLKYGPNGKEYTKNDIQYLVEKGYTKEAAIELLSKDEKYTKELDYEHLKDYSIKTLAKQVVQDQLDIAMLKGLEKCKSKFGIFSNIILDEDCIAEMRAIIRGHKTVELKNTKLVKELENDAERKIKDLVDNQITRVLELADKIEDKVIKTIEPIDKIYNKIDKFIINGNEKINTIFKDEKSLSNYIGSSLESLEYKQLRLEKTINKIETITGTLGLNIDIKSTIKPVIETLNSKITGKITTKLMPHIKKHIGEFRDVQKRIEEARKKVNAYRDNFIKEQKQRLSSYLNKEASRAIGSLKDSLKKRF